MSFEMAFKKDKPMIVSDKDHKPNKSEMVESSSRSVCIGVNHTAKGVIPCPPCSKLRTLQDDNS